MITHRDLTAACWAGLIALDFTGCGPFMLSQPLVCGPLFGWLLGHVAGGVIIGGIIQLLWMDLSPVGVGIPYDATSTTLLAVYWAAVPAHTSLSQIVLALLMAVPFGFLFRGLDRLARRINTLLMHQVDRLPDEYLPVGLWGGIFGGIAWSWARYALAYGALFWLGRVAWDRLAYSPRLTPIDQGLTMAVLLLPVAGMGVTLELFLSDEPEGRWAPWRAGKPAKNEETTS